MPRQKLTTQQRRVAKLARKCGMEGFADSGLDQRWGFTRLAELLEESLDDFESYLKDFAALQESLRSPN